MKNLLFGSIVFVLTAILVNAQTQSDTYPSTRRLLLRMERYESRGALKKLFEFDEKRKGDLIQGLYDSDAKVSLSAQVVIRYLADARLMRAFEEWVNFRKKSGQNYSMAKMSLLSEPRYLEGSDRNLAKLVLNNLHPDDKDVHARQIAFNKSSETALIEVVFGNIFTEGWHVVIRKENGEWRLLSNSLVWQS